VSCKLEIDVSKNKPNKQEMQGADLMLLSQRARKKTEREA
jgi:hypothetical protein